MVNVVSKKCKSDGCTRQPSYNMPGKSTYLYCLEHKLEGMISVINNKCRTNGCLCTAYYNAPGNTRGFYCKQHCQKGMVDVVSKLCIADGCSMYPVFNMPGEKTRLYCSVHKQDGMIYACKKMCQTDGCLKAPSYNFLGETERIYCGEHRQEGMVCLKSKKTASATATSIILSSDGTRLCKYCDICENTDFICKTCRSRSHKKEWGVVQFLRREIHTPFRYDTSSMLQGCSQRRPDIFFDTLLTHCVIVEIDENQHRNYADMCECARISEIVGGIGGRPIVFIRYNPDNVRHKRRICNPEPAERAALLKETVQREILNIPSTFCVRILQLWFDDVCDVYQPLKEEDITSVVAV